MNFLSQNSLHDFTGKRVLVRVDFNVPLADEIISPHESYRIESAAKTIEWLQSADAKIILLSHIGRQGDSLRPVADYIQKRFPHWNLEFIPSLQGQLVSEKVANLKNGNCILLENVRSHPGEESNDLDFAGQLASLGELYVNDAFAASHRKHASIVGIPKFLPSFAGFLVESEIHQLQHALHPIKPSVLIMGGIKFETKLPLIEKFLPKYQKVILGGGLLNTFLKQSGYQIGKSTHDTSANLESLLDNRKIIIPDQVTVERDDRLVITIPVEDVQENDCIVDIMISHDMHKIIENAQTIVWNGPLGWYERGYVESSRDIAFSLIPEDQVSLVGGGDTVTLLKQENLDQRITFLSTGGGAMLEYLEQGTLPGLEVLK